MANLSLFAMVDHIQAISGIPYVSLNQRRMALRQTIAAMQAKMVSPPTGHGRSPFPTILKPTGIAIASNDASIGSNASAASPPDTIAEPSTSSDSLTSPPP